MNRVLFLILLFSAASNSALSATYYVSTSGSDSNPGTSARPFRNPQKCVAAGTPLVAGDVCVVKSGIYVDNDNDGIVLYIRSSAPKGTRIKPITIKSETPMAARISIKDTGINSNTGIYVNSPFYIIEGFDIDGSASTARKNHAGIVLNADGVVARKNRIHHIGRNVCDTIHISGSVAHVNAGLFVHGRLDPSIENNIFYSIGRRLNGESGCVSTVYQHDHGIYAHGTNLTIRRNLFYDVNRGYPIHIYGGTTSNLKIYHNTLSGKNPTNKVMGQIRLASTINGAYVVNNISHNSYGGFINAYPLTAVNVNVSYNLSDSIANAWSKQISGLIFSRNLEKSTNLGFVNSTTRDYHLKSTSSAINQGTTINVPAVKDSRPDIGAYEYGATTLFGLP